MEQPSPSPFPPSSCSEPIKGFRLFGTWISIEKTPDKSSMLMKTRRTYSRRLPRTPKEEEEEKTKWWSYKENIGEILVEKVLTRSDINQSCRLLLPRSTVKDILLPILKENNNPQAEEQCKSNHGVRIDIFDADDDETNNFYTLALKQWATRSYVLTGSWRRDFVKRRNLKEDDQIGLFWNQNQGRFNFSVKQDRRRRSDCQV